MARRKRTEEPVNHERWLVSYADFITLLFGFFVVMYSVSSVNEDKYRVLSNAMLSAFSDPKTPLQRDRSGVWPRSELALTEQAPQIYEWVAPALIPFREGLRQTGVAGGKPADESGPDDAEAYSQEVLDKAAAEVDAIADEVENSMDALIEDGVMDVKRNKFWLEINIKSNLLFPSGGSGLFPESVPVLLRLSDSFRYLPNRIHVEGFTDNEPIRTPAFPSNWELSSARAAAVVRLFERHGVDPSRMASIGYGEHHPVSDNDTEEGRAMNRRVVIVVISSLAGRQQDRFYEYEVIKDKSLAQAPE